MTHPVGGSAPPEPLPRSGGAPPPLFVLGLFFASGATGLVYQVVWLRQLTLIFGATAYASSAVLSTFMGGLALGSAMAGRSADRWPWPALRTYGALELGIALYAAAVPWLLRGMTPLLDLVWRTGGESHFALFALAKFLAIAILILPATTLMGATLPVLARVATRSAHSVGGGVGLLYATNTFGAVVGTIAAAFLALPRLGTSRTLLVAVVVNLAVGVLAWRAGRGPRRRPAPEPHRPEATDAPASRPLVAVFAASGFAAMVLEVAWTRGLALVLGSSVYAYASMLTAFLIGLAAGAATASRFLERGRHRDAVGALALVLGLAGLFSFGTAFAIQSMPRLFAEIYFRFGPPPQGWWLAQLVLALAVMFPATYLLGWVFPLVLEAAGAGRSAVASRVGRVYSANTAGTIVGAAAGGFVFVPFLGVGTTLIGVACFQLLLGAAVAASVRAWSTNRRRAVLSALIAGAAACVLFRPAWDVQVMNSGVYMNVQNADRSKGWGGFLARLRSNNEVLYARDGLTASVFVARQPASDNLYLAVNGKTDASSREDLETQIMAGHLPLLLHPAPRDVLVVGLASGISVGSVATHPVESVRVVEVEEAIVPAARIFGPFNGDVLDDPRVTVSINDARNDLQFHRATYDVIVSEPSNPWMTVASNLFTEDFFRIAKTRLRPDGVLGQWIQTYSLAPELLRSILAGFDRVFAHVVVFETLGGVDLMLVGSDRPLVLATDEIEERMSELRVRVDLARVGVRQPADIVAMLQTGGAELDSILAGATVNTDDNGLVEFAAPKSFYAETQDANMALLRGPADDPLEPLWPLIRSTTAPDELRLALVKRWVRRDQRKRALEAARFFGDSTLSEAAHDFLHRPR